MWIAPQTCSAAMFSTAAWLWMTAVDLAAADLAVVQSRVSAVIHSTLAALAATAADTAVNNVSSYLCFVWTPPYRPTSTCSKVLMLRRTVLIPGIWRMGSCSISLRFHSSVPTSIRLSNCFPTATTETILYSENTFIWDATIVNKAARYEAKLLGAWQDQGQEGLQGHGQKILALRPWRSRGLTSLAGAVI